MLVSQHAQHQGHREHHNVTKPSFTLLVTPVLSKSPQVKMSANKKSFVEPTWNIMGQEKLTECHKLNRLLSLERMNVRLVFHSSFFNRFVFTSCRTKCHWTCSTKSLSAWIAEHTAYNRKEFCELNMKLDKSPSAPYHAYCSDREFKNCNLWQCVSHKDSKGFFRFVL